MTGNEADNTLHRLQIAALVVCGALLIMVAFTMLFALASKNSATEVQKGNTADACRDQFAARITDARTNLDNARAEVNVAQFDGLVAATIDQNEVALAAAIARGRRASAEIAQWQTESVLANNAYQQLLAAEVDDPTEFKRLCKEGP